MRDQLKGFFIKFHHQYSIFRNYFSNFSIWVKIAVMLLGGLLFLFFRFLNYQDHSSTVKALAGVLRNDYLNANSYALSKALADLELLNVMSCAVLTEKLEIARVYYDTTENANCIRDQRFVRYFEYKTEMAATNGLVYELKFQMPIRWSFVFVELLSYILFLLMVGFSVHTWNKLRAKHDLKIRAIALENEMFFDKAKKIHHDVASPITALRTIVTVLNNVDPEVRDFLARTVTRTEEIISQLNHSSLTANLKVSDTDLEVSLKEIIDEKQRLWGADCEVECELENLAGCKILANEAELKAIISNVMNNAFESYCDGDNRKIKVIGIQDSGMLNVEIIDYGRGIPSDILSKVGTKGFSYGKVDHFSAGAGLGVYNAIQLLKNWGGQFLISSEVGLGTKVTMLFRLI